MVFNVCRRILRNDEDAEDAFQATFLVFVRRAASINPREQLGNWLYGVSSRTAMRARALRAKRQVKERNAYAEPESALSTEDADNLRFAVDEALESLPEIYRSPIILCLLEGRSRREVAKELGLAEGTLSSRLAKAKIMLGDRLIRRGVTLSAGVLLAAAAAEASKASASAAAQAATFDACLALAVGKPMVGLASPGALEAVIDLRTADSSC